MKELRAIVRSFEGFHEAQVLELDIAVSGKSIEQVVDEIRHAIVTHYYIARKHGQRPFVSLLGQSPEWAEKMWVDCASAMDDRGGEIPSHSLGLPEHVMAALIEATNAPAEISFHIQQFSLKAA